ncbi:polycystic kidney disease protein 1-like 2 [Cheilinus undulatus]|uniref:polycystic kidney disease protein 1-like 2 n=1 Tax=Cheilinus undulatus TaxID=241271 RepID=UPI001BD380D8|nr:polycystic kidney disease protein 1-like 2 [Cheilinus undulatus]
MPRSQWAGQDAVCIMEVQLGGYLERWVQAWRMSIKDNFVVPLQGPLFWLDNSPVTYSKWVSHPQPGASCAHILRDSGFLWKATKDCNKELHFICQFEAGSSIVCPGCNTTLQCSSGQVLMIDGAFHGRKRMHYCRCTLLSLMTPTQQKCSWVDVQETLADHCQGRQSCQVSELVDSFGEPCPHLGSYLSVEYHCQEGLTLSVSTVAAVYDDVTIRVKWLLDLPRGNLECKLSTGEGQIFYLHISDRLESSVMYRYTHPRTFAVEVECAHSDIHVTAQKIITIQEPVAGLGVTGCYARKLSFRASDCKALDREPFEIQIEVKAGSNVTYRIQRDGMLLSSLSVVRGNIPRNITVASDMMQQLGPGCHWLTLYASNMVTVPEASAELQMCVLEKVGGLQASVLTEQSDCEDSSQITISVSLEHGAPVQLLFILTGDSSSVSETRKMRSVQVKLRAWNDFSSLEVEVDMFNICDKDSLVDQSSQNDYALTFFKTPKNKHIRVARGSDKLTATTEGSMADNSLQIVLSVDHGFSLDVPNRIFQWKCKYPCECQGDFNGEEHIVKGDCIPDPFEFNKYHFNVLDVSHKVKETASICITFTPEKEAPSWLSTSSSDSTEQNSNEDDTTDAPDPDTASPGGTISTAKTSTTRSPARSPTSAAGKTTNLVITTQSATTKTTATPGVALTPSNAATTRKTTKRVSARTATSATTTTKNAAITSNIATTTITSVTSNTAPAVTTKSSNTATTAVTTKSSSTATTAVTTKSSSTATTAVTTKSSSTATTALTSPTATAGPSSSTTVTNSDAKLKCSISPNTGTTLDAFTIICNTKTPCSKCQYCLKTQDGKHLRCSQSNEMASVFLPPGDSETNYKLIITATAKNSSFTASATIATKVKDYTPPSGSAGGSLSATVENVVEQLKEQGLLTGETVGQICSSVSNQLNSQSSESGKAERQKLREQMLSIMTDTLKESPSKNPEAVQVMARGLTAVSKKGSELSTSAQKKTSDSILLAMDNTLSALLVLKDADEGPSIIQEDHISLLVNRVTPSNLQNESMTIPNCSCSSFSLPTLPSEMLPSDDPVDVRLLSFDTNPFSWNENGNISGSVGSLSLTLTDGSKIPVENLSDGIEIFLPRPVGEQVNTSVLDLGNYSTTVIDIPSGNDTLVLKMVPSKDPLPFKVLLGFKDYPTETNHVAMTEMPQQGATLEEKYTWLLDPDTLKGNTGEHYLVVRPIVGPGIKSINASLSITPITSSCKFWDESALGWSTYGCKVGVQSTPSATQCLCNHLTFFGSSFFVTPNLVDPSRTAELFATFAENPVVVCFVGALFVGYLVAVIWARRKDIKDTVKVKVTVLDDNNPMDEYRYLLSVSTGYRRGASTSSQVAITLMGTEGNSEPHHLMDPKKCVFERGAVDLFLLTTPFSLGDLQSIRLWHNNSGSHPAWYVGNIMVQDLQTEQKWHFLCNSWLAIDIDDCSLDKVFPVSPEVELKRFSNLFFMKTTKDFSDGHLWYSVVSRPPCSTFTCVQRVSCCFSLLLCTMLTSIMFYGIPTDPSEQTLDLGHFEFTWQQFMIGVQSSLIMFPVNILIVSVFRNTRPWETSCRKRKAVNTDALEQLSISQTVPTNVNVTIDTLTKDVMRMALSLSTAVKSNNPSKESESGPGQHVDINAVLSEVEDYIKQNNKNREDTQSKDLNLNSQSQPQIAEGPAGMHPSTEEGIQKKSNKTQYLYRQLCHIDRQLTLLGPSGFPSPQSYSQALQQVQGMKGSLEDQLLKFSCAKPCEPIQKKPSPTDRADSEEKQKEKKGCCHGGLPWWFIFIGWLLVVGTSVVAGYFTMLYGLKFGKDRSVSWLVSQTVSFFQSILVIQPLKVVCLAIFFALVIKRVDEEDVQNIAFEGNNGNQGEFKDQKTVRRDDSLYAPPPAADIEKMKRNKIMEQKAFALIREILTYLGYMWMLLLVAYGQRDPNAFFLNRHIRQSFSRGISHSISLSQVFTWANTSLLENLFGVYPGFITDGNSKLVGNARLRQLRVQANSCQIADSVVGIVRDCNALYSWEVEDMGSYDPGWTLSAGDNISNSISSPWKYQTQDQLRAYPFWGKIELYRGGGFVAELGPDLQNASRYEQDLFRNKWLDVYTRAIFVEFTVYNANVNLFCIVTLLLETTAIGAFQFYSELRSVRLYQSTGALHVFVMAAEIIYMLFILYYMFLQGKLMKQQRLAYFKSKRNIIELTIILLSWSAFAVYIKRTLLGNRDVTFYQNHKDQFASFYETAAADSVLQYLIAFLVLLSTIKLWHLLRLNPKMNLITATLERAWSDISGFLLIIAIMVLAYSTTSNVIYGWKLNHYRTFTDALLTIISLQIGIFNYNEVLSGSPWLGGILFGSCTVFMSYIVLNLLISVILVAFTREQIYHKPSDEEEIVDLMLKKICSFFGIRYKNTTDTKGPDGNGDVDSTLNNNKNIHYSSSIDANIFQIPDHSVPVDGASAHIDQNYLLRRRAMSDLAQLMRGQMTMRWIIMSLSLSVKMEHAEPWMKVMEYLSVDLQDAGIAMFILIRGLLLVNRGSRPGPDLNPTGMLWNDLKRAVHTRQNMGELKKFCKEEWSKIPPEHCAGLISSY